MKVTSWEIILPGKVRFLCLGSFLIRQNWLKKLPNTIMKIQSNPFRDMDIKTLSKNRLCARGRGTMVIYLEKHATFRINFS
jgi:hypothetical protein